MPAKTYTMQTEVTAVDIPTMAAMPLDEYELYVRHELVHVDHHDVLRSLPAGYPLATNKAQLRVLIAALEELEPKLPD